MFRLLPFITSTILCISCLTPTVLAVPIAIQNSNEHEINSLNSNDYVTDIAENHGNLYFMVTGKKIISTSVNRAGVAIVYTPDMLADGVRFLQMEPASCGGLWVLVENSPHSNADRSVVLFQDGKIMAQQTCSAQTNLSVDGAIWKDDAEFICWNGTQLTRYPIPTPLTQVGSFVLWNGRPCWEDWGEHGKILAYQNCNQATSIFSLSEGVQFSKSSLFTCKSGLYLSYRTNFGHSHTVRISDKTQLNDMYYNVQSVRLQSDGTAQLTAVSGSTNYIGYTQVSIFQDSITERDVGEYLVTADGRVSAIGQDGLPTGWRFLDSTGYQWIYSGNIGVAEGAAAVTEVAPDGTAIAYTAEHIEGITLYYRSARVVFDVGPYITDTGFAMVPIRGIAHLLNATITWDKDSQTVTVHQGKHTILVTIGSINALEDGAKIQLESPAVIVQGRTMVPLRFLIEALDGTVRWEDGTIYIDYLNP